MMWKPTMVLLATALIAWTGAEGRAETADEFEKSGLAHFREAYYKAVPQKDPARAAREFAMAERDLKQAVAKSPGRVSLYQHLGRIYYAQERYVEAVDVFRHALEVSPETKMLYLQLAGALEMTGDYGEAVATLGRLRQLEKDPQALQAIDGFIQTLNGKMGNAEDGEPKGRVTP